MRSKKSEVLVGLFMLIAIAAAVFLCLKVADLKSMGSQSTYEVKASFTNVGGLKEGSPVKVGGVVIGRVASIDLGKDTYVPEVTLDILSEYDNIPDSSSLSIRTSGLLGEQFIAMNIGFSGSDDPDLDVGILKEGSRIEDTKPAMVLEDLIGQLLYKSNDSQSNSVGNNASSHVQSTESQMAR